MFDELIHSFSENYNIERAQKMSQYMRNQFTFYGIPSPLRKKLLSHWKKENKMNYSESLLQEMWKTYTLSNREIQYSILELLLPILRKNKNEDHLFWIEKFITTQSWWDTVDYLASSHLGLLLKQFPEKINETLQHFTTSHNLWLQRSTLLYQLKYKEQTHEKILFQQIEILKNNNDFFIQKAIGWALRELAKTKPKEAYNFVDTNLLSNLAKREAQKHRVLK